MARLTKAMISIAAILALALMAGFAVFANSVKNLAPPGLPKADGIVVLTGGDDRIAAGLELIAAGNGRRLLISGVHSSNRTPDVLRRHFGGNDHVFKCCIDLGYDATSTIGNADEARDWAETWGYRSLLVVTSSFHMPRSLAEFSHAMPRVKLIAYPVAPRHMSFDAWWRQRAPLRLLAGEYLKFLASAARLGVSRAIAVWDQPSLAERRAAYPRTI